MASADDLARWIVDNADKKGTEDFATVQSALEEARGPKRASGGSATEAGLRASTVPPDMQLSALQKMYPDAQRAGNDFTYTDEAGAQRKLAGPSFLGMMNDIGRLGANVMTGGNLPGAEKGQTDWQAGFPQIGNAVLPAAEMAGAALGAAGGFMTPIPGGTIIGAGAGAAIARDFAQQVSMSLQGVNDTRTPTERMSDAEDTFLINAAGQGVGQGVGYGLRAGIKGVARGGEEGRKEVISAINDAQRSGTFPTVAQATKNKALDTVEALTSKFPGGSGVIQNAVDKMQADVAAAQRAKNTAIAGRQPEAFVAGLRTTKGIEQYAEDFKARAGKLYGEVDSYLAPGDMVSTGNTAAILNQVATPTKDAENFSQPLINPKLKSMLQGLTADLDHYGGDTLPYSAMTGIRSKVGGMLGDASLTSDIPRGDLKRVYAALTNDLRIAAQTKSPEALKAFDRASAFYKAGMQRIDDVLEPLIKNRVPEQVFAALENQATKGPTPVRAIRKSVTPDQWRMVAATVADHLGQPAAGQAGIDPQLFSFQRFLTGYNTMVRNGTADAVFSGPGMGTMKADLDALARHADRIRVSSRSFNNPSGTSGAFTGQTMIMGALGGAIFGSMKALETVAGAVGGSFSVAKLMTSPAAVHWLAEGTRMAPNRWGAWLGRGAAVAADSDPQTRDSIINFAKTLAAISPYAMGETRSYEFAENGTPVEVLLQAGKGETHRSVINRYIKTGQSLAKGPPGTFQEQGGGSGLAAPEMPQDSNYGAMASFPLGKMQIEDQIDPRLRGVPQ